MKKKVITISAITGIIILGLCIKLIAGSRDVSVLENTSVEESVVSGELKEQSGQEKTESEVAEEVQPGTMNAEGKKSEESGTAQSESEKQDEVEAAIQELLESGRQNRIVFPRKVEVAEPVVKLNGKRGKVEFFWDNDCIRIGADTLLFTMDCYFAEEKQQQKIFFTAEAPDFKLQEVFRQDSRTWDKTLEWPEDLEKRMARPHPVDGGYVYELDGVLYFLDEEFKEASPLCDLRELMGELYAFSPGTSNICDVTADATRMIVCTDEGLYEYNLESGEQKLLESASYAPYTKHEGDCACGPDFSFSGPVRVEYGPDDQNYAFLTGSEEAAWGVITGAVLRSGEGETLYQLYNKETEDITEYVSDFKWVELEDATYLAVFYDKYDGEKWSYLMDRVDVSTGEVVTFEVPVEIYYGTDSCVAVGFLDADTILYRNLDRLDDEMEGGGKRNRKDIFEIYRLSSGERQDLETVGDVDWGMMVLDIGGYDNIRVRYPK